MSIKLQMMVVGMFERLIVMVVVLDGGKCFAMEHDSIL
jgi:hypothetical protein